MERPDRIIERSRLGCDLSIEEEFDLYLYIEHLENKMRDVEAVKNNADAVPISYREKIEIIFGNKLEYNGDNQKAIEEVKVWLGCEWQCSHISLEDYIQLRDMVEPIAEKMIKDL